MLRIDVKRQWLRRCAGVTFAVAVLACVGPFSPVPALAGQNVPTEPAAQLLQNGYDALSDKQPEEARQFFERVMRNYPRSTAAQSAERALEKLRNSDDADTDDGDSGPSAPPSAPIEVRTNAPVESRVANPTIRRTELDEQNARLRRAFLTATGDRVFFAENSALIGGRARAALETQARWLKARSNVKITVISRADDGGSSDDNAALSQKRAEAVRDKLVEAGLLGEQIVLDARGDRDPVATCRTQQCQAQNRHVETLISFAQGQGLSGLGGRGLSGRKDAEVSQPVSARPLTR